MKYSVEDVFQLDHVNDVVYVVVNVFNEIESYTCDTLFLQVTRPQHPMIIGKDLDNGATIRRDIGCDDNNTFLDLLEEYDYSVDEAIEMLVYESAAESFLNKSLQS